MADDDFFSTYFSAIAESVETADSGDLERFACMVRTVADQGGKVILVGNGGSAAMASHVAVD